jgi:hypothetical protein
MKTLTLHSLRASAAAHLAGEATAMVKEHLSRRTDS